MNASLHPQLIASRNHIGDFFDSVKILQTDITYLNIYNTKEKAAIQLRKGEEKDV